ncbi:MAG: hypothetical protein V4858_09400 [Pseudomonadota bacterium]
MSQSSQDDSQPVTIEDLVAALIEMRDSLTRLSLVLRDHRFNLEANQCHPSMEQLKELLEKLRSRS